MSEYAEIKKIYFEHIKKEDQCLYGEDEIKIAVKIMLMALGETIDIIERLTKPVNKLKHHLSDEGDYSIARTDKQTMGWGEVMMIGNILEEIDEALKLTEE